MVNVEEMIKKSLEDIDTIIKSTTGEKLEKGFNKDVPPEQVSQDAPAEEEKDPNPEEGTGEEGNEEEDGANEPVEDDDDVPEETQKSLAQELSGNDNIKKALEVSDFLSDLVKGISDIISGQDIKLTKSLGATEQANEMLAKSFVGIAKSQRAVLETQSELLKSVRILNKKVKNLETLPTVRKSVSNVADVTVLEKSFGVNNAPKKDTLSKSEAMTVLTGAWDKDKSYQSDLLAFESTGDFNMLSDAAKNLLNIK